MITHLDQLRVIELCRIILAGFEAERAAWKAGLELSGMNVCGATDPESHMRDVLDWAERGCPDEDAEIGVERRAA